MQQLDANIEDLISPLKQRMELLLEENRTLKAQLTQARQELTDLKHGVGITVLVGGKAVPTGAPEMPQTNGATPLPNASPGRPYAAPALMGERYTPDVAPNGPPATPAYYPNPRAFATTPPEPHDVETQSQASSRYADFLLG